MEQRAHGFDVWQEPLVTLRVPKLFNLRTDPFERADHEGLGYVQWRLDRVFALVPAQAFVRSWLESFKEFPPRQKPGSFNLGDADRQQRRLRRPAPGARSATSPTRRRQPPDRRRIGSQGVGAGTLRTCSARTSA